MCKQNKVFHSKLPEFFICIVVLSGKNKNKKKNKYLAHTIHPTWVLYSHFPQVALYIGEEGMFFLNELFSPGKKLPEQAIKCISETNKTIQLRRTGKINNSRKLYRNTPALSSW